MHLNLATDDGQIRVIVRFADRVDGDRLARAAGLTLEDEPVLQCGFVERAWRSFWEWQDSSEAVLRQTEGSAEELIRFMAEPADPGRAPQVHALLCRTDRDMLCIRISHLVADAAGAIDYTGRLAKIYRRLGADAGYRPRPDVALTRHPAQVLSFVSRPELARAVLRRPVPRALARWGLPEHNGHSPAPVFLVRGMGPERVAALARHARLAGTSMTGLLLAAFARALFEVLDPPASVPLPVAVPMNLRRYLPAGRPRRISNLTGALLPALTREPGSAFGETLAQAHAALKTARTSHSELAQVFYGSLAMLPGAAVMRGVARRFQVACPVLSNLGVIDPAAVDFGGSAEVQGISVFGPVQYPPAFGVLVNTFRGTATVTTGTWDGASARRLLDTFLNELPA